MELFFNKKGNLLKEKLAEEKLYDGVSFLFTTSDITITDAIKAYFDKDVVEKCFHSLKGVVRRRLIRHWLYDRVEAHVFICYLSCLMLSILKLKVAPLELSVQEALDELEELYRVYLKDPKKGFLINRLVALSKKQEKILRTIDKQLLQDS